jgi:phosphoenolpyruvate carboxylase
MLKIKSDNDALNDESQWLGELLDIAVLQTAGGESLQLVDVVRRLSINHRAGMKGAGEQLQTLLASLTFDQLRQVIRALTIFLDLTNVAEDRHRLRVLRDRAFALDPQPRAESVQAALLQLKESGKSADDVRELLDRIRIELVFTAHPTEAKRRSVRSKLRRVRRLLAQKDSIEPLPSESKRLDRAIRGEITKLWLTDFIRPWRPTVLQEVKRGLSIKPNLWRETPRIMDEVREAFFRTFPGEPLDIGPCISFGTWIGGDRDGHPYVTTEVTEQTIQWLRQSAIELHNSVCDDLFDSLSISTRQLSAATVQSLPIEAAAEKWPPLDTILREIPPNEVYRRWLAVIRWRLERTAQKSLRNHAVEGAYASECDLYADVTRLGDALRATKASELLVEEVLAWLERIHVFGFHLARLDVRQDSRLYRGVVDELLQKSGLCKTPSKLAEADRQELLASTMAAPLDLSDDRLSTESTETLSMFRLLRRVVRQFGRHMLGSQVVSMTHEPSDIIGVLWLWNHADSQSHSDTTESIPALPVVPLFETIHDLQQAPRIMESLLQLPSYREHVQRQGNRQTVMLGYSDSTKDGGYLAACWSLHQCQRQLDDLASREGIRLTFFHGRGGSLGRGGGPAARSILSLPRRAFHGSIRLTEQGEVLSDRYDDPRIAHRHLEQLMWSSLLAAGLPEPQLPDRWYQAMQQWAESSFAAYRRLIEQPEFVRFFRLATPINEIEQLPIGSRPSRRRSSSSLSDLRAIPWVFSWTQSRCLIPAWYGLGTAMSADADDAERLEELKSMYQQWPFFRAMIDNAELALAKTDPSISRRYAQLASKSPALWNIAGMIAAEFKESRRVVLRITGHRELLDGIPWLKESIRVRNQYIDPLNFIQVELLGRLQALGSGNSDDDEDELRHLTRLTINGLAAGMRTSG